MFVGETSFLGKKRKQPTPSIFGVSHGKKSKGPDPRTRRKHKKSKGFFFFGAKVFHHQFFITQDLLSLIFFQQQDSSKWIGDELQQAGNMVQSEELWI